MSLIRDAKNLYIVDDRTTIKNYINRDVDYWVKMDTVPTLEQVIEDLFDNDEFICQSYEESKRLANKDWLEMLSVYSIAKNIQNLVSFNMPDDFDESKCISKKKKLQILESDKRDDLFILLDKYFNADTYDLTEYHFESGLWTLDYEYDNVLERMKDVIRYNGKRVASFGYCGYPNRAIYNGLYANDIPELGYSHKDLKDRIKDIIIEHGAEVI